MITTSKVKPSPKELFSILMMRYIKKRWWLIAWIWTLAIIMTLVARNDSFYIFFMVFATLYPIILVIQFWRYVNSKDNKILLLERYYEIDTDKINSIVDQDTYSPIKLEHFIKVEFIKNTYLLYLTKNQFIFIPAGSFKSKSDLEWFEKEIISRIKK